MRLSPQPDGGAAMMMMFHDGICRASRDRSPITTSDPGNGPVPSSIAPPARARVASELVEPDDSGTSIIAPEAGGHSTMPSMAKAASVIWSDKTVVTGKRCMLWVYAGAVNGG